MSDNISIDSPIPYIISLLFIIPALAFSYFVNSGIAKNDDDKVKMFIVTFILLAIPVLYAISGTIN